MVNMFNRTMANRRSKSLLWCHSIAKNSLSVSASFYVIMFKPFKKRFSFIVYCYKFILSRISFLFFLFYPSAIKRAIMTIGINSVDCQIIFVAVFHTFMKNLKRFLPCRAHYYIAPTIIFISCGCNTIASCFDALPNVINSCFRHRVFCVHNIVSYKYIWHTAYILICQEENKKIG